MSTVTLILYKPETPLNPNSLSVTGSEYTLTVGSTTNSLPLNGIEYTCTINNLKFEKKVYRPCELSFQLDITAIAKDSTSIDLSFAECAKIAAVLKNYGIKLQYPEAANVKNSYACLNYYIYTVKPQYSSAGSSTSIRLFITAYSVDHRLSLQKTNRAFTAKKFLSEVVVPDLADNLLKDVGVPVNHSSNAKKYLQFIKSYKKTELKEMLDGTRVASYTDGNEIIQPYMVQYNETYYNFLARTANRCGEFMYFEDGQLNIGLDKPYYEPPTIIDYDTDTPPSGKSNSRKSTITSVTLTTLADPSTPKLEPYYPKTMDKDGASVAWASSNFVEDAKVGNDEFLVTMEKGKWVDWKNDLYMMEGDAGLALPIVADILNNQTLSSMMVQALSKYGIAAWSSTETAKKKNDAFDSSFWDVYAKINDNDNNEKIFDGSKAYIFTSNTDQWDENLNGKKILTEDFKNELRLEFYHALLNYEREVMQEAITVETGVNYDEDVKLGKVVQVNGTKYVVVGVSGEYSFTEGEGGRNAVSESYSFTGIPVKEIELSSKIDITYSLFKENADGSFTPVESGGEDSIPTIYAIIPPIYEHGHICYSPMQRAIVANAGDPKSYGRVQIKYPWQTESDEKSPFVRVAKDWAGDGYGINFKTETGTEVLIDYEGGNVERPFVVGMLHSFVEKPQIQPRSIKSYNGHKIVFNDPKDGTKMFWDMIGGVASLATNVFPGIDPTKVLWEGGKKLSGGIELSDAYGFYKIAMSTHKRQIDISSPFGKVNIDAFTGINISAPNGNIKICGKNVEIEATNNLNICSGSQIDRKFIASCEGGLMGAASGAVGALVGTLTNLILPDITFFRCIAEAFIKPCNGTLRIKSYRYLMLESGQYGLAQIPKTAYKENEEPKANKGKDNIINYNADFDINNSLLSLLNTENYNVKVQNLIESYNAVCQARILLTETLKEHPEGIKQGSDNGAGNKQSIINAFVGGQELPTSVLADDLNINDPNSIKVSLAKELIERQFRSSVNRLTIFNNLRENKSQQGESITDEQQKPNPQILSGRTLWDLIVGNNNNNWEQFVQRIGDINLNLKTDEISLSIVKNFITQINNNSDKKIEAQGDTVDKYITSIAFAKPSMAQILTKAASNAVLQNSLTNFVKEMIYGSPFSRSWSPESHAEGQILFSDSNANGGITVPLTNLLGGDGNGNDSTYSVNTIPGIKAKLRKFLQQQRL